MHVTERPILKSGSREFFQRDGSVIRVTGMASDIGVKHSHGVRRVLIRPHSGRKVFRDALTGVADAGNARDFLPAPDHRFGVGFPANVVTFGGS